MDAKPEKKVIKKVPRTEMPTQPPMVRIQNYLEVALGYTDAEAHAEADRCIQCKKPLCRKGCPVEIDIKGFIGQLQKGDLPGAYKVLRDYNSLPAVCGRVCPQETQCEGECVLGKNPDKTGGPVCIGRLERYVADTFAARLAQGDSACLQITGEAACRMERPELKVACIGGGPSSLTVAGYLAALGIKVTVFEALHEVGGVLVYGIPEFRLPKGIVRREIDAMKALGVEFKTNWVGGKAVLVQELLDQGYKAVFLGVGAGLPQFMNVPGENNIGVFSANEYLTRVNLGRAYDFVQVVEHFAERADMILLLFDAHKLDISDEFKRAIEALRVRRTARIHALRRRPTHPPTVGLHWTRRARTCVRPARAKTTRSASC